MKSTSRHRRGFTLVEIMIVVLIVGILAAIAIPAMLHVKRKSEDTLALNTIRHLYDAKEMYFTEDGAGKRYVTLPTLVKAGYASHSLDVATQHEIGAWQTTGLRGNWLKPGDPVTVRERYDSGGKLFYGRTMVYPGQQP